MRIAPIAVIVLISTVASAQQSLSPLALPVTVSKTDCQRLIQHVPAPDVAYQPGVDVHGKSVAPADLPSSGPTIPLPDQIQFNYTINPTNYGLTAAQAQQKSQLVTGNNSQASIATIKFDLSSQKLTVNGQPLSSSDQQGVIAECRKRY